MKYSKHFFFDTNEIFKTNLLKIVGLLPRRCPKKIICLKSHLTSSFYVYDDNDNILIFDHVYLLNK